MQRTILAMGLCALASAACAGPVIKTACQRNEADGRILIQDYRALPFQDATFTILRYRAVSRDGGWSMGPCTIRVTGHAR